MKTIKGPKGIKGIKGRWTVVLSIIAGLAYRAGGIGKPWNTKYRDFGVPLVAAACWVMLGGEMGWNLALASLLLFGSLTTYWGFVNKWFGKPTSTKYWWNWMLTGLGTGLAYFPLGCSSAFWIRTLVLGLFTMVWSEVISEVFWEEFGRGFLVVATIPILFI